MSIVEPVLWNDDDHVLAAGAMEDPAGFCHHLLGLGFHVSRDTCRRVRDAAVPDGRN